jgi:hypothetical protein
MAEPITTEQIYDLRAMSRLWAARKGFPPDVVRVLDSIYRNKKASGSSLTAVNEMRYSLARSKAGQAGYGRYVGLRHDLGGAHAPIRAALTAALYHDLDIANCQPVLLSQLASQLDVPVPSLEGYVQHREETLAAIGEHYNCSRADAKQHVIATLNGPERRDGHPLIIEISKEARTLAKALLTIPEWKTLWDLIDGDGKRTYGRFISYVYFTLERRCLVALREYLLTAGWSPDILICDGLMVRKRDGLSIDAELLAGCSDAIHAATGFRVQLTEKPLEAPPEEATPEPGPAPDVSAAAYAAMKKDFEVNHFYLAGTCKVCEYDIVRNAIRQYSAMDAKEALNTWRFPAASGKFVDDELFVPLWLKDPTRRTVHEIRMGPLSDDPTVFVIPYRPAWEDGDAPPIPADADTAVAAFQTFLGHLVPEEPLRNLLIEWIADLLQRPFVNSQTCIVLAGGKGCGKDTLGDFIGNWLLGEQYYRNYDSTAQFWDPYDNGRFGRILVKVEETEGALNRQHEAAFKARITTSMMTVNPKYEKPLTMPNYVRYLLTTNEATPVKLDDQERRFVVIQCGRGLIGNMDYWRSLHDTLFNRYGAYAVARWLMEQKLGIFPRVLPKSELHQVAVDADRSVEERFVASSEPWGKEMTSTDLFPIYRAWCFANGEVAKASATGLGKALAQVALDGKVRRRLLGGRALWSQPDSVELV